MSRIANPAVEFATCSTADMRGPAGKTDAAGVPTTRAAADNLVSTASPALLNNESVQNLEQQQLCIE